jgi:hypothetical protein
MRFEAVIRSLIPFVSKRVWRETLAELDTYKQAFQTTVSDRDRIAAELAQYRVAFESTANDRDILLRYAKEFFTALGMTDLDDQKLRGNPLAVIRSLAGSCREDAAIGADVEKKLTDLLLVDKDSSDATNWRQVVTDISNALLAPTLDVGGAYSFQLDFRAFDATAMLNAMSVEERQEAKRWIAMIGERIAKGQFVDVLREVYSQVGLRPVLPRSEESFYRRNALFAYAHILGYQGRRSEALDAMDASGVKLACAVSDLPLHVHDIAVQACLNEQSDAIRRDVPSVLIVSVPKSASAFLSDLLKRLLGMAEMRTSFCEPPYVIAYAPWLQAFFRGGAISHEHYAATTENVQVWCSQG